MDFSQSESQELFNHLIVLILNDQYIRFMYIHAGIVNPVYILVQQRWWMFPKLTHIWFVVDRDRQQMYWFRLIIYKS